MEGTQFGILGRIVQENESRRSKSVEKLGELIHRMQLSDLNVETMVGVGVLSVPQIP